MPNHHGKHPTRCTQHALRCRRRAAAWPGSLLPLHCGRQAGRQAGRQEARQRISLMRISHGDASRAPGTPQRATARGAVERSARDAVGSSLASCVTHHQTSSSDVIISSSRHAAPLRAAPAAAWRAGTGTSPSIRFSPPEHSPGAGLVRRRAAPATRPVCRDCADAPAPARCARRAGEPSAHCRGRPYWRARRAVIGAGARAAACCAVRQAAGRLARSRAAAQAHAAAYQYLVRGGRMRRRNTRGTRTYHV